MSQNLAPTIKYELPTHDLAGVIYTEDDRLIAIVEHDLTLEEQTQYTRLLGSSAELLDALMIMVLALEEIERETVAGRWTQDMQKEFYSRPEIKLATLVIAKARGSI